MLDIGCGDGSFTILLREAPGARVVHGADISARAIEMAGQSGIEGHIVGVDEEPLPFSDAAFDAVIAGAIIEHLVDPEKLLAEIYICPPSGTGSTSSSS
jgi:ubiquinone/menaquinone biosynthesis C-methylase UbiE